MSEMPLNKPMSSQRDAVHGEGVRRDAVTRMDVLNNLLPLQTLVFLVNLANQFETNERGRERR